MSGASRAQNSIGKSCANASFFGRTSSPFREKTCAPRRFSTPALTQLRMSLTCMCSLDLAKDHKVKLLSERIFIRKLCEITCRGIKRSACTKRRGNITFVHSFMKYFAIIISVRARRGR